MHHPAGTFLVEYAKSSRSVCKKCQGTIKEDTPRIGMYVQSRFFDGATPMWYHANCSLKAHVGRKLMSIDALQGLDSLRWEDTEKIRKEFDDLVANIESSGDCLNQEGLQVEYAKSGGSKCRGCEEKIAKGLLRLGFLVDGPYGPIPAWHHDKCRPICEFMGHSSLSEDDLSQLAEMLGGQSSSSGNAIDSKTKTAASSKRMSAGQRKVKSQNDQFWLIRDELVRLGINKEDLKAVLEANNILPRDRGEKALLHIVADSICFGVAPRCKECKQSRLIWNADYQSYKCPIDLEWGPCSGECNLVDLKGRKKLEPLVMPANINISTSGLPIMRVITTKVEDKQPYQLQTTDELKEKVKAKRSPGTSQERVEGERVKKIRVKGGSAVDPDSGLVDSHHVYEDQNTRQTFSVTLMDTNIQKGRNSYYNIQLLEGDWVGNSESLPSAKRVKKSSLGSAAFYVFRKWGRVGTDIGDCLLERCDSLAQGIESFKQQYKKKTGNEFGVPFVKKPNMFFPLDLEKPKTESDVEVNRVKAGEKTKLSLEVQTLLLMIFDVNAMRRTLLDMEFDVEKMPLGQISKRQISEAYSVLDEIMSYIKKKKLSTALLQNLTNQFYTLVPHDFGSHSKKMRLLDSTEMVNDKMRLLEAMQEIEIATTIIKNDLDPRNAQRDPLDVHYESLKCHISPLNSTSKEWELIAQCLSSTHAPTHNEYSLELQQIFQINRSGEIDNYKKFLRDHPDVAGNRKLLWHGSRVTNFVGILSHGLLIAPPEAPNTGAMFGKGIYFADLVSKSANYCCATEADDVGLLVLSEVALGQMHELAESEFIKKLPAGFHSTKGCGKTVPKSFEVFSSTSHTNLRRSERRKISTDETVSGDVQIPMGPPVELKGNKKKELLYNEFIVYETSQSCIRFLVQVKFRYKSAVRE